MHAGTSYRCGPVVVVVVVAVGIVVAVVVVVGVAVTLVVPFQYSQEGSTMEATTVLETEPGLMDGLLDTLVIIRTVTHYYTGRLIAYDGELLQLSDAAWVPDTGRWSTALAQGTLSEVEPYPDGQAVYVAASAVVDITQWHHDLPRTAK